MREKIYVVTVICENCWIKYQKMAFSAKEAKRLCKEMMMDDDNVRYNRHIEVMEFSNVSNEGRPFTAWMD